MEGDHVFVLSPQLNLETVEEIRCDFCNLIADNSCEEITCSFAGVKSIDTAGIQLILALYKSLTRNNRQLLIRDIPQNVLEFLEISGVGDVLSIRG